MIRSRASAAFAQVRGALDQAGGVSGHGVGAHAASMPRLLDGLQLYDSQPVQYSPSPGRPPVSLIGGFETSAADGAGVLFYTSNWDDAYSSNVLSSAPGAATFMQLNPYTALSPQPAGMRFCCDQVVRYVPPDPQDPPAGNFFVWVLQYGNTSARFGNNVERVAVATPNGVATGKWAFFDVSGALVNHTNAFLDFPDVEVGQHHVYLTFNEYDASMNNQGATVMRFLRGELGAIAQGAQQGLPSYQWYNDTSDGTFRVAQDPTPGSVTYFVTEKDDSDLTVYAWDETPNGQISKNDVGIPTVGKGGLGLPNGQWLGSFGGPPYRPGDERIKAVTTTDVLWPHLLVAFQGGSGDTFPQPQIDIADVNLDFTYTGGFSLNRMNYIWSPSQAFGNPELASNEFGDVAISFWHNAGGSVQHAIGAIGPNLSDPTAPLLMNLGPDTTGGANTAGGRDFTSLGVSYVNSNAYDSFPCFSEAQWTGTLTAAVAMWDTFGVPGIGGVCPTFGPAVPAPSPPLGGQTTVPSLSLSCAASIQAGSDLPVSGTISPAPFNAPIRLLFSPPSGQGTQFNVDANPEGQYYGAIVANTQGTWSVQAFYDGSISYAPTQSTPCHVTVTAPPPPSGKQPSDISLYCPMSAVQHIGTINVSGAITPTREGAPVTVVYTQPDGTTITDQVTTVTTDNALDGSYFDSLTPEQPGTWTIQSSWPGDATYDGKYSRMCYVSVSPEPPR